MSFRSPRTLIFIALIALTTVVPRFAEFYTDWLWFKEVGFEQVFLRSLTASTTVAAATGLVVFAILWANLAVVFRSLRPRHFTIVTTAGPQVISIDPRRYRPLVVLVAGIAALLVGAVRRLAMGDVAVLPLWHALRQDRSDPGPRHRLLRLHAPAARDGQRDAAWARSSLRPR